MPSMQIFIKLLDGNIRTIEIEPDALVELLKERVKEITGMPLKYQRLIHNGKQLQDSRYLSDYNIQKDDTIYLTARLLGGPQEEITLTVKTLEARNYSVKIRVRDTVKSLKKMIEDVTGVYWEDQNIFWREEKLDNDMALELYGIDTDGITVFMIKKIPKCSCTTGGCV